MLELYERFAWNWGALEIDEDDIPLLLSWTDVPSRQGECVTNIDGKLPT